MIIAFFMAHFIWKVEYNGVLAMAFLKEIYLPTDFLLHLVGLFALKFGLKVRMQRKCSRLVA